MSSKDSRDTIEHANGNGGGEPLSRQVTLQLSPEQYERLFFQPSPPRGDLAKRLGNPTLLGLFGFLIPFQTTMFACLAWRGASTASFTAMSGCYYFFGGIAMVIAGLCEFILGNTFPFAVFVVYGVHWVKTAYDADPVINLVGAYGPDGAASKPYNSGQAFYNVTMCLISTVIFLGSLRTNVPFALAILMLIPLFALFAAAFFRIGYAAGPADLEYAGYLIKVAGGLGMVTAICGWYLAIITACASTGVPCPLPVFDLSTQIGFRSKAAKDQRSGAEGAAVAQPQP